MTAEHLIIIDQEILNWLKEGHRVITLTVGINQKVKLIPAGIKMTPQY